MPAGEVCWPLALQPPAPRARPSCKTLKLTILPFTQKTQVNTCVQNMKQNHAPDAATSVRVEPSPSLPWLTRPLRPSL